MFWIKENLKIFSNNKKDSIMFFLGTLFLVGMVTLRSPKLISLQTIVILITLTSINRYNFVTDYILKSDIKNLKENGMVVSYILCKNLLSLGSILLFIIGIALINLFISGNLLSEFYYINLISMCICVLGIDNIVFIFFNKPSKLTSKEITPEENIKIGLKDLIESLPSIILVIFIYFINKNIYEINLGMGIIFWVISIILLRKAIIVFYDRFDNEKDLVS